jgi:hypothetical protein
MTGLFFITVWIVWFVICVFAALWLAKRFTSLFAKLLVGAIALAVLLPLPVLDEILAKPQMVALCKEGATLRIDAERIKGRKVRLAFEPSNEMLDDTYVPIRHTKVIFRDADSGEVLGSFDEYYATGGVFIRTLGISESNSPIWMKPTYCSPPIGAEQMAAQYQFEIIRKSK